MGTAKFNFNNGNITILCSNCDKIVKNGKDFNEEEWKALEGKGDVKSVYCDNCKDSVVDFDNIIEKSKNSGNLGVLKDLIPMLAENPDFKESLVQIVSEKILNNIKTDNGE
jgi:hypothetical protein